MCTGVNSSCLYARNFSVQFMNWCNIDKLVLTELKYGKNHTGMIKV